MPSRHPIFWFVVVLSTIFKGVAIASIIATTFSVGLSPVFASVLQQYRLMFHPLLDYLPRFRGPLTEVEKDVISIFLLIITSAIAVTTQEYFSNTKKEERKYQTFIVVFALINLALILVGFTSVVSGQGEVYKKALERLLDRDLTNIDGSIVFGLFIISATVIFYLIAKALPRRYGTRAGDRMLRGFDPLGFYVLTAVVGAAAFFALDAFTPG